MTTRLALVLVLVAACFTPVSEPRCATDAACPTGVPCVDGHCLDPDAGRGDGGESAACEGCLRAGQCLAGDWWLACGRGANPCLACADGQQCIAGTCVVAQCGPLSCTGCCSEGHCLPLWAQVTETCGTQGSSCVTCEPGQACRAGSCLTLECNLASCATATDAGPGAAIGAACDLAGHPCQLGAFCLPESGTAGPNGFPGGACASACGSDQRCPAGAVCVSTSVVGVSTTVCMASCSPTGSQGSCRPGYVCAPLPSASGGWCRPSCINGYLASCPVGQACDPGVGLCRE